MSLILKPVSSLTIVNTSSIFCSVSLFTLYVQEVDPVPEMRIFILKKVKETEGVGLTVLLLAVLLATSLA